MKAAAGLGLYWRALGSHQDPSTDLTRASVLKWLRDGRLHASSDRGHVRPLLQAMMWSSPCAQVFVLTAGKPIKRAGPTGIRLGSVTMRNGDLYLLLSVERQTSDTQIRGVRQTLGKTERDRYFRTEYWYYIGVRVLLRQT